MKGVGQTMDNENIKESRREYLHNLLVLAQAGDRIATDNLINQIKQQEMRRRIGKYLHKNRQAEDEDLIQEFLIGVALSINKADLEVGDPIEYIIYCGVNRVRSYLRQHIMKNTTQVCIDCGYESRLNRVNGVYVCKKCGSIHIETRETHDHDEIAIQNKQDDRDDIADMIDKQGADDIIERFRATLDMNTRAGQLFVLFYDEEITSDNPDVVNYIKEIADRWKTSQVLVLQTREKLQKKLLKFCQDNGIEIMGNHFIQIK